MMCGGFLGGENQTDKIWIMSRILESAKFEDVWKYTTLSDVRSMMSILKIKNLSVRPGNGP